MTDEDFDPDDWIENGPRDQRFFDGGRRARAVAIAWLHRIDAWIEEQERERRAWARRMEDRGVSLRDIGIAIETLDEKEPQP
jgi:hypothetical protein